MSRVWYVICAVVLVAIYVEGAPKPEETEAAKPETPAKPEIPEMPAMPAMPEMPAVEMPSPSPPPPPQLANGELAVPDCKNTTDVYDMSQNGTDNYKVNVKGFTFLLAGSDTVLGAAMLMSGLADKNNAATAPVAPVSSEKVSRLMGLIKQLSLGGRSINVNLVDNKEGDKQAQRFLRNVN